MRDGIWATKKHPNVPGALEGANSQDALSAATDFERRLLRRAAVRLCITPTFAALSRALCIFCKISLALASSFASPITLLKACKFEATTLLAH